MVGERKKPEIVIVPRKRIGSEDEEGSKGSAI